jgi:hypothetical protein
MVQCRSGLGLTPKAFERLRVSGHVFWKKFESDKSVEASVLGLIDDTHPTAAEFFEDAVVRDGLAD